MSEASIARRCAKLGVKLASGRPQKQPEPRIEAITSDLARRLFEYRDGQLIRRVRRGKGRPGQVAGHLGLNGYVKVRVYNKTLLAHRVVWLLFNDQLPAYIDHINGNRADNRIENLRAATHSQNLMNVTVAYGQVPFKGVSQIVDGKFQAQICQGRRPKYLGIFATAQAAAEAYDKAAIDAFGPFAKTNRQLGLL